MSIGLQGECSITAMNLSKNLSLRTDPKRICAHAAPSAIWTEGQTKENLIIGLFRKCFPYYPRAGSRDQLSHS